MTFILDTRPHARSLALIAAAGAAAVAILALTYVIGLRAGDSGRQATVIRRNCQAIEKIKGYIEQSIVRAIATLPTLAYYKQNPGELDAQLDELKRQRSQFAAKRC